MTTALVTAATTIAVIENNAVWGSKYIAAWSQAKII
jgi:hypothetical protein